MDYQTILLGAEKYIKTSVLVSLVLIEGKYHFLLQNRADHIRQGGEICFPGGRFDAQHDKTLQDTAVRETIEELGIAPGDISIWRPLGTLVALMGVTVESYIGILNIDDISKLNFNKDEVASLITIPISYFKKKGFEKHHVKVEMHPHYEDESGKKVIGLPSEQLGLPVRYHSKWGQFKYPLYSCQTEYGTIWGITAELIYETLKRFADQFQASGVKDENID